MRRIKAKERARAIELFKNTREASPLNLKRLTNRERLFYLKAKQSSFVKDILSKRSDLIQKKFEKLLKHKDED
jgi:hypothetical protein